MAQDIVLSRVMCTVKDKISPEDIVFYLTHGQLEVLPELSGMHGSAAYGPEPHTPPALPFTLTHVLLSPLPVIGFSPYLSLLAWVRI